MNAININPSLSEYDRITKSGMDVLDFNIDETQKRLANYLDLKMGAKSISYLADTTVMAYDLDRQMMIDQVMNELQHYLDLEVLFVKKSLNNRIYDCVAYSKPYIGSMNIVHLYSNFWGVIEDLKVNVYGSMENMYQALKKSYNKIDEPGFQIIQSTDFVHVIKEFH
jgi:hypothetical protein